MKILYHHRIRSKDGQAVHVEELISALRELGHEVVLVGPGAFDRVTFGHDPKLLAALKRIIPRSAYELLELTYNVPAYLRLRRASRTFRPDVIYERYNLYLLAGVWYANRVGVPTLLEVNAPLAEERSNFGGLGFPWLATKAEKWVWRNAGAVLAVTRVLAGRIEDAGVTGDRVKIIPNAIQPSRFQREPNAGELKRRLGLADRLVIGFVGFVREWNGLDAILELLGRRSAPSKLHFVIVGDGPAIPALREKSQRDHTNDRVTFAGLVERDEISTYLAAFDIAVIPKCVDYCSPLKLFEYMIEGKAIVAPDQPNIREVLTHGENAVLFAPDDQEQLAEGVLSLARDAALRERLGRAAKERIISGGYTWQLNARRVVTIAEELAKPHVSA